MYLHPYGANIMISDSLRSHMSGIIEYLDTVVIKFAPFATILDPDQSDIDNIYYRTLNGDHTVTDTEIIVTIPITNVEVQLTKQVLEDDPMLRQYLLASPGAMNRLFLRYPDNKQLISRIFYPIDIDVAIQADDFTLLYHDTSKLDEYEVDSMTEFMTSFIKAYSYRWYINTLEYDDLYPLAAWSLMWYVLPLMVLVQRINNLDNSSVHPYFIWEYLTSNGYGSFRGYFNRAQSMFLYNNNNYISFNVGKNFMLDIFTDVFFTPMRYSLEEVNIKYTTDENQLSADKTPKFIFGRLADSNYELKEFAPILELIHTTGLDPRYTLDSRDDSIDKFKSSPTNSLGTKYLLSTPSSSDVVASIVYLCIMDSLAIHTSNGLLGTLISVDNPKFELPIVDLTGLECLNLITYCLNKGNGITLIDTTATYSVTKGIIAEDRSDLAIDTVGIHGITRNIDSIIDVDTLLEDLPYSDTLLTVPSVVSSKVGKQFEYIVNSITTLRSISETNTYEAYRALLEAVVPSQHIIMIPQIYSTYNEWLSVRTDIAEMLDQYDGANIRDNYLILAQSIISTICPMNDNFLGMSNGTSEADAASKMLELFRYISSYNINIIDGESTHNNVLILPPLITDISVTDTLTIITNTDMYSSDYDHEVSISSRTRETIHTSMVTYVDTTVNQGIDAISLDVDLEYVVSTNSTQTIPAVYDADTETAIV